MENKVTITATKEGVTIQVEYDGKIYTQKGIPTRLGIGYEGEDWMNSEIPDGLAEVLDGFFSYDLVKALNEN